MTFRSTKGGEKYKLMACWQLSSGSRVGIPIPSKPMQRMLAQKRHTHIFCCVEIPQRDQSALTPKGGGFALFTRVASRTKAVKHMQVLVLEGCDPFAGTGRPRYPTTSKSKPQPAKLRPSPLHYICPLVTRHSKKTCGKEPSLPLTGGNGMGRGGLKHPLCFSARRTSISTLQRLAPGKHPNPLARAHRPCSCRERARARQRKAYSCQGP